MRDLLRQVPEAYTEGKTWFYTTTRICQKGLHSCAFPESFFLESIPVPERL
jgi:hypothetical protein